MILVDECRWQWRGRFWCHCVSDTSYDELHNFARTIGVPRVAFQGDHYDLDENRRARAIAAGATATTSRLLVRALSDAGLRRGPSMVRHGLVGVSHLPTPTLTTERLLLRQWTTTDLTNPDVRAIATDQEVHADATLLALRGLGRWAVEDRRTAHFVGRAGLIGVPFAHSLGPAVALAATLLPSFRGQGYGREASDAVIRYGFGVMELSQILAFNNGEFDTVTRVFHAPS